MGLADWGQLCECDMVGGILCKLVSGVGKQGMAFNWTSHWLERKEIKGEGAVALASEMHGVKSSYLGLLK